MNKMNKLIVISLAISGIAMGAPGPSDAAKASNTFGFNLLRNVSKTTEKGNKFISPVSLYFALAMLNNGAQNETAQEIEKVLAIEALGREGANTANRLLLTVLNNNQHLTLQVANSLWARKGFTLRDDFRQSVTENYRAGVTELDFGLPTAAKTINDWVLAATNNKIDRIVPDAIPAETVLYLINAANFEAEWEKKFPDGSTRLQDFHVAPREVVQVPTMFQERGRYRVLSQRGATAIEIPYKGNNTSMIVVLPEGGQTVDSLVQSFTEETWSNLVTSLGQQQKQMMSLSLPKLKFSYDSEDSLNDTLKGLGMPRAFDRVAAQLKGISDVQGNLFVSNVKQKTFVQVDEDGTKAAAVSSVEVGLESAIPRGVEVNRPFLFAVVDHRTTSILFIGTVKQPEGGELPKPKDE